jgi:hypothetical protein
VATLARQDGQRPRVSNDYYRVREACRAVEARFGLHRTAPGDRTAPARPTRAETEKTRRRGWHEVPRVTLRREVATAAATASGEDDFLTRLQQAGVQVRLRFSIRNPGEVTGYAVALPGDMTASGGPVWFGGGKLAADLTLPKLRRRWADAQDSSPADHDRLTPAERAGIWDHAARTAGDAAGQIHQLAASDPAAAADAAWAAGDTLHAAAAALGSRVIRQAAAAYDRAARAPYGRIPRCTPAGTGLRRAARLLSTAAYASHDQTLAQAALIARLAALADAVAELRQAQQHAAQAAGARAAAERLYAAAAHGGSQLFADRTPSPAPTALASQDFPTRPQTGRTSWATPGRRRRGRSPGPAHRRPAPPRRRRPAR